MTRYKYNFNLHIIKRKAVKFAYIQMQHKNKSCLLKLRQSIIGLENDSKEV